MTTEKPKTRISILVPCEIDDTKKLMDALNHVAQKLRVSKTIRGYAGEGFAWTVSAAEPANKAPRPDAAKSNKRDDSDNQSENTTGAGKGLPSSLDDAAEKLTDNRR